ncbi:MAG TPA: glycosyltransferase family 4 protein [Chloroflexota bacterium]|nr:glycosyltransferase family 4 protein [Chloroflexota bacterium]
MAEVQHILFVVEYYYPHIGGGEIVFQQLAEGLAARGICVDVVTCLLPGTQQREELNGVSIHRVRVPQRGRRHWFSAMALPTVLRLIRPNTIIHTNTHNGAFPAWVAARLRRVPSVMTVYEVFGPQWALLAGISKPAALVYRTFESIAVRLPFDWQICISRYTQRKLEEYYPSSRRRSSVIYAGVDQRLFDPTRADGGRVRSELQAENRFIALYFGRPGYAKGLDYLIDAVPDMARQIPNLLVLMLLADEPRKLYDSALHHLQPFIEKGLVQVNSPVARAELPNYLAAADCVVIPSLSEGFGLSAAEACAMGRPVVATTGGALPEVVSGAALLVDQRSSTAIAAGVLQVVVGDVPCSRQHEFQWSHILSMHLDVYDYCSAVGMQALLAPG